MDTYVIGEIIIPNDAAKLPVVRKQAEVIANQTDTAALFRATDGSTYADIEVDGHRETWPLNSKRFKLWLARRYREETGSLPNPDAVQNALTQLDATAQFDGAQRDVCLRVGGHSGRDRRVYLDLSDEAWRAVEIDADGWRIVERPDIRFRRPSGARPLPVPIRGGSIHRLKRYINVTDRDFILVVGWLLAALREIGPYPLLIITGEQGTAKSALARILKMLVDPTATGLRTLPRSEHDLFIAASNSHVLGFDNVSQLPPWISDALCRLATGGGFGTRQLYSDGEEAMFVASRPILVNGIDDFVDRADLADRSIMLSLSVIPEDSRITEKELFDQFLADQPAIFGALLDGVSEGLRRMDSVQLAELPRMADFMNWVSTCETAFWTPGTFSSAYRENLKRVVENVLDADAVACAVRSLMQKRSTWKGTASALLRALIAQSTSTTAHGLPRTAVSLSKRLQRASTFLRKSGIEIERTREGPSSERFITISWADAANRAAMAEGIRSSEASELSESEDTSIEADDIPDEEDLIVWDYHIDNAEDA